MIKKVIIFFFLLTYSFYAFAFKDKQGREISLEWDITLSAQDKEISHKAYLSQKEHYEKRSINFKNFFDEYNQEIANELQSEIDLPLTSPQRIFHLLRAKHNDTTCGFAYFKKKNESVDRFYLEFIALAPEYQGSGIGKHLVFEMNNKPQKLRRLSLDTREFNLIAQEFYKILGFTAEISERKGYLHYAWEPK